MTYGTSRKYGPYGFRHRYRPMGGYRDSAEETPGMNPDGTYLDATTGINVAYNSNGKPLKPPKKGEPTFSRNTKANLWKIGTGIGAAALGIGAPFAAALGKLADPRTREAAINGENSTHPLHEPSGDDRSFVERMHDRLTKFQTGANDYYGDDEGDEFYSGTVAGPVIARAVESIRESNGGCTMDDDRDWYDDTELESICDRISYAMTSEFYDVEDNGDHFIVTDANGGKFKVSMHVERMDADK